MRKLFLAMVLILVLAVMPCQAGAVVDESGYEIVSMDVFIKVQPENVLDITERITLNFKEERHGIERFLPRISLSHMQENGRQYASLIGVRLSDFSVTNDAGTAYKWEESNTGEYAVYRIGDPNEMVFGSTNYVIRYKYDLGAAVGEEFQSLYYNILNGMMGGKINYFSFRIDMPKDFDESRVNFYMGEYGATASGKLSHIVSGKSIIGSAKDLGKDEIITIKVDLPKGYFSGEREVGGASNWVVLSMLLGILAVLFVVWNTMGKEDKIVPTVEFYPPDGLTSAEVGYIIDRSVDQNDLTSLFLYWANNGFIGITEDDKEFTLVKLKDADDSMKPFERQFFNKLFAGRDQLSKKDFKWEVGQAFQEAEFGLRAEYTGNRRIMTPSAIVGRWLSVLLGALASVAVAVAGGYSAAREMQFVEEVKTIPNLFKMAYAQTFLLGNIGIVGLLVFMVALLLLSANNMRREPFGISVFVLEALYLVIAGGFGYLTGLWVLAVVWFAVFSAAGYFGMTSLRRTDFGREITGKVIGFKNFINTAEKDRLEMLAAEDHKYFYNVLAYAFAFGYSDKWVKKFENINIVSPDWYYSSGGNAFVPYYFTRSFGSYCHTAVRAAQTPPSSMDRGGGFGGGGFGGGGFGGGGGFSGGGHSSGGMGSW